MTSSRKAHDADGARFEAVLRDLDDTLVVGEQQHLGPAAELAEHADRRRRAAVVEVHEDVVEHHRQGLGERTELVLDPRDAQGEIELVARPVAQRGRRAHLAAPTLGEQDLPAPVVIGHEVDERAVGKLAEQRARTLEKRPTVALAVRRDGPTEHFGAESGARVVADQLGGEGELGFGVLLEVGRCRRVGDVGTSSPSLDDLGDGVLELARKLLDLGICLLGPRHEGLAG